MTGWNEWLRADAGPKAAIVAEGSDNAFIGAVLDVSARETVRVLASDTVAQWVSRHAGDRMDGLPTIVTTADLLLELRRLAQRSSQAPVYLPFSTITTWLSDTTDRATRQIDVLAGYPPPQRLVAETILEGLRDAIREFGLEARCRLAVHDRSATLFAEAEPSVALIDGPIPIADRADAPIDLAQFSGEGGHVDEARQALLPEREADGQPPIGTLIDHAEFLIETEIGALRQMHDVGSMPSMLPIYVHWIECFMAAEATEDERMIFEHAAGVIGELAGV